MSVRAGIKTGKTKKVKIGKKLAAFMADLCRQAVLMGASEAVPLSAADVVVDERTRLKCLAPICTHYRVNLSCPPNVMPVAQFREVLKAYHGALMVKVPTTLMETPEELTGQTDLSAAFEITAAAHSGTGQSPEAVRDYMQALRDSQNLLHGIIIQIESLCLREGYSYAAGFGAGGCTLCDECVGAASGLPCRHPYQARPSLDAVGINVMATARKAGVPLDFSSGGARSWVSLVLID